MDVGKPQDRGYTVYGSPDCSYCVKVAQLLESKGISFQYYNVDQYYGRPERKRFFEQASKVIGQAITTIPVVFLDGEYIGGYQATKVLLDKSDLLTDDF